MENKNIKQLAEKILEIELKLQESYDSKLLDEIYSLVKELNIDELMELDEEISKNMGMSYPQ